MVISARFEKADGSVVVHIACTRNFFNGPMRIVAVDAKGREHVPSQTHDPFVADLTQLTATFQNLPLKQIKYFRLQTRPYQWVEFRNVPLQPGQKRGVQGEKAARSDVPWGDWNAGWSVRLRAAKSTWTSEELPEFTIDLRKRETAEPDTVWQTLDNWLLEVDGRRFRFDVFTTSWEHKQVFEPGTARLGFITFHFHRDETGASRPNRRRPRVDQFLQPGSCRKRWPGIRAIPSPKSFPVDPGQTCRAGRLSNTPTPRPGESEPDLAFSNPLEVQIEEKPSAVVEIADHPGGPWIAKLPAGVTVELKGVGGDSRWWRPDGLPLEKSLYDQREVGDLLSPRNEVHRMFLARVDNQTAGRCGMNYEVTPRDTLSGPGTVIGSKAFPAASPSCRSQRMCRRRTVP